MRNLFISFIGSVVLLSGMHVMPTHAMDHDETMSMMCSSCVQANQMDGHCDDDADKSEANSYSLPSADDCDCSFESPENNHHEGMIQAPVQFSKTKSVPVGCIYSMSVTDDSGEEFYSELSINAPPPAFIVAINTVRQLK